MNYDLMKLRLMDSVTVFKGTFWLEDSALTRIMGG